MSDTIKKKWKAGNMVYPLPAVMVSCKDGDKANIITVAWTGTICTNPAMVYISVRPERYSYDLIKNEGYFAINLTTTKLAEATDFCGVRSGRDVDKFKETGLIYEIDEETGCPMIVESPVSIICETTEIKELGSHHMFIAMVKAVYIDESLMNESGKFELTKSGLLAYAHGTYLATGRELGTFGYSVNKKRIKEKQKEGEKARWRKTKPNAMQAKSKAGKKKAISKARKKK